MKIRTFHQPDLVSVLCSFPAREKMNLDNSKESLPSEVGHELRILTKNHCPCRLVGQVTVRNGMLSRDP